MIRSGADECEVASDVRHALRWRAEASSSTVRSSQIVGERRRVADRGRRFRSSIACGGRVDDRASRLPYEGAERPPGQAIIRQPSAGAARGVCRYQQMPLALVSSPAAETSFGRQSATCSTGGRSFAAMTIGYGQMLPVLKAVSSAGRFDQEVESMVVNRRYPPLAGQFSIKADDAGAGRVAIRTSSSGGLSSGIRQTIGDASPSSSGSARRRPAAEMCQTSPGSRRIRYTIRCAILGVRDAGRPNSNGCRRRAAMNSAMFTAMMAMIESRSSRRKQTTSAVFNLAQAKAAVLERRDAGAAEGRRLEKGGAPVTARSRLGRFRRHVTSLPVR